MDGSASASSPLAERARLNISRAFVNKTTNDANAHSELFEQLLNLSFTVQPPPEKESLPSDTTTANAKDLSKSGDKEDASKVDEDKEDEPTVEVATLTQAVPVVADKPTELSHEQKVEPQSKSDAVNLADSVSNDVTEQPTPTTVDAFSNIQVPSTVEEQVVKADTDNAAAAIDTSTSVVDSTVADTAPATDTESNSNSKKAAPTATKFDETNTQQPNELTTKNAKEPKEASVAKAPQEIAIKPEQANAQNEDSDDRHSGRREKWFEHKDDAIGAGTFERNIDASGANPPCDKADVESTEANDASSPSSTLAATPTNTPEAPTIASPVALPVGLSIVPQISSAESAPIAKATSTASPESTTAVSAVPSRAVGSQTAKPNSKEKVTEPGLSQQERVRVIQRIARSFNRISADGGTINLRLHPEHLGSVSMQVRLEGRSLSARLSTETTAARDAIMQDLPALRQRLADQGFDVSKFQVDVAGNGADASFAQSNGGSQFGQSENRSSGSQTDYRRVAANREARAATGRQTLPAINSAWQTGAGIDLQA